MSSMSNFLKNAIIEHFFRGSAQSSPSTVYLALFTSDPTDADTGDEVTGGAYSRQVVTFGALSGGNSTNTSNVTFPIATAGWGTITHFGVYDASSGGNLINHAQLVKSKAIDDGDQFIARAGELVLTPN